MNAGERRLPARQPGSRRHRHTRPLRSQQTSIAANSGRYAGAKSPARSASTFQVPGASGRRPKVLTRAARLWALPAAF